MRKGPRAFLGDGDTLVRLGQMDASDDTNVKSALDQLDEPLAYCESQWTAASSLFHPLPICAQEWHSPEYYP